MPRFPTLAAKLASLGAAFLLLALASIALTLWVTWQLEGGAAAINEAGRMRMLTWRLALNLQSREGTAAAGLAGELDRSLALLRDGDPSRPLFVAWEVPARGQFDTVVARWSEFRQPWLEGRRDGARLIEEATVFVGEVDRLVLLIERQLSYWTAILNLVQLGMMALAIASAVVMLYLGYLFVLNPLARLRSGLKQVEQGDLGARVEVASKDEFGALSAGFNSMAGRLESLYRSLEDKVREKTASLEEERARLAALYDVSDFLSRAAGLDEMVDGFTRRARIIAGADAVAVRWTDEAALHFTLLGGDCLPEAMVRAGHGFLSGPSLCGTLGPGMPARAIPIAAGAAPPLDECARAGFETLVVVPVRLQGRVLGEICLFHRGTRELEAQERGLLDALAAHLAAAMEGRRASALDRESAVAEERGMLARELHDSIAQSLSFLKIQAQLLRDARRNGDHAKADKALDELDGGLRESIGDVRELLMHFRTRTNAEDIEPALRSTLTKFETQTGLPTHLSVDGHALPLAPDVQVQVLHVLQEALSNVRKHARASQVWLEVHKAPAWRFEVRDDGRGFDAAAGGFDETHVGLRIMQERARRVGATVEVDSVPGSGTCVSLRLPRKPQDAAAGAA